MSLSTSVTTMLIEHSHEKIRVSNKVNTKRPVQSQKQARSLKFWIEEEGLYYPCSENKGADQLCSYCTVDLRLYFRLCRLLVFPCGGSIFIENMATLKAIKSNFKTYK